MTTLGNRGMPSDAAEGKVHYRSKRDHVMSDHVGLCVILEEWCEAVND
jgi:hypothetical protein